VKPGMTLLSALQKNNILPESVIATRAGEMILEDEILKDGDVIKLIAVISGGSCHCDGDSPKQSPTLRGGLLHRGALSATPGNGEDVP